MNWILVTLILVLHPAPEPPLTTVQTRQIRDVEAKLLAPCCYTQSIALHESDVAVDMRHEVVAMVVDGKTEQQIIDHYEEMYGDRILILPGGLRAQMLFRLPLLALVVGAFAVILFLRNALATRDPAINVDSATREKIDRGVGDSA
ncbi:MAG: cytochrome c-type biogenesis protein CcmH [Candidatus Acidiferrales bacterium]